MKNESSGQGFCCRKLSLSAVAGVCCYCCGFVVVHVNGVSVSRFDLKDAAVSVFIRSCLSVCLFGCLSVAIGC